MKNEAYERYLKNESFSTAYERYLKDESFRAAILATAHRERTKAIRSFIVAPLLALLKSTPRRQTRMLRRSYC